MLYYRVVKGDKTDYFSGCNTTIEGELLTEKERNRKFRYLTSDVFELVSVSRKKTYWCFGARFELKEEK